MNHVHLIGTLVGRVGTRGCVVGDSLKDRLRSAVGTISRTHAEQPVDVYMHQRIGVCAGLRITPGLENIRCQEVKMRRALGDTVMSHDRMNKYKAAMCHAERYLAHELVQGSTVLGVNQGRLSIVQAQDVELACPRYIKDIDESIKAAFMIIAEDDMALVSYYCRQVSTMLKSEVLMPTVVVADPLTCMALTYELSQHLPSEVVDGEVRQHYSFDPERPMLLQYLGLELLIRRFAATIAREAGVPHCTFALDEMLIS